jgi:hypothetical protein
MRKNNSTDGLASRCKKCDKIMREQKKMRKEAEKNNEV